MSDVHVGKESVRRPFDKVGTVVPVPDLIEVQSSSFNNFAQLDYLPEERELIGLQRVLRDTFPIECEDQLSLEFVDYELGHWACTCGKLTGLLNRYQWDCSACKESGCSRLDRKNSCPSCKKEGKARYSSCPNCLSRVAIQLPMTFEECYQSGQTFSMPLKVRVQLISWATDEKGERIIRDIKEQRIFFADVPVMADIYEKDGRFRLGSHGTFLINGVERVVVSQLHRSPGVIFSQSKKVKDYQGRAYYLARIIPMRGSWLDFEFDSNEILYVRVDKKKKLPITTFLQALGYGREEIISLFHDFDTISVEKGHFFRPADEGLIGQRIESGMVPDDIGKPFLGKRVTPEMLAKLKKAGITRLEVDESTMVNTVVGKPIVDETTGELLYDVGEVLNEESIAILKKLKKGSFSTIRSYGYVFQSAIALTLAHDRCASHEDALRELHAKIWPGESATLKDIQERFETLLFNSRYYDLTKVGRIRMNRKLGLNTPESEVTLTKEDIVATVRYLVNLRERGEGELDDIDHLGNRRVRLVGELLNNQMYLGFVRVARIVRERFRTQEPHGALTPQDLLNVKPVSVVLREFFGMGQLSQFADQTNPLAELAHNVDYLHSDPAV